MEDDTGNLMVSREPCTAGCLHFHLDSDRTCSLLDGGGEGWGGVLDQRGVGWRGGGGCLDVSLPSDKMSSVRRVVEKRSADREERAEWILGIRENTERNTISHTFEKSS